MQRSKKSNTEKKSADVGDQRVAAPNTATTAASEGVENTGSAAPPAANNPVKAASPERKLGLMATAGSVLAAFFGVQSAANWKRDVESGRPWLFMVVALVMTLALVVFIAQFVRLIVSGDVNDAVIQSATNHSEKSAQSPVAPVVVSKDVNQRSYGSGNPMELRVAPCTHCHLDVDIDTRSGYVPRIAGKPAGYLYSQLIHFRDGRRRHAVMNRIVQNLPESYLLEMAEWFAIRKVPYPPPAAVANKTQKARGEQLATAGDASAGITSCAACHGSTLVGMQPNVPGLLGLPETYLMAQFTAWRSGRRQAAEPDCMHQVVKQLGIEDQQAVSAWLASRPVPRDTTPAAEQSLPVACGSVPLPPRASAKKEAEE